MPIQGTAADIMKIAMIRVAERLRPRASGRGCCSRSTTSSLLEVPRDEVDRLVPVVRETMEGALPLTSR